MKENINIGFPIDLKRLIETRLLIQANSGAGKSWLMRSLAENIHGKVPFIIIDLEGEFVTLREKYDIIIFGKGHDIQIQVQYADKIAHYLLELHASAVMDLSELQKHERILFVKNFLESMIDAPKKLWHPTMIMIDEAHQFCPEDEKSECAKAVVDLCTRGRKRGYCAVLATQRISKLRKDAAAELNNKCIGRTSMDVDVKRTAFELGMNNSDAKKMLSQLNGGEFYVFGPAISKEIDKRKVSSVKTTHVTIGMKFGKTAPPSNAVQRIIDKIADIPKEVEEEKDTEKKLKEEILKLRLQLKTSSGLIASNKQNGHSASTTLFLGKTAEQWNAEFVSSQQNTIILQKTCSEYKRMLDLLRTNIDKAIKFSQSAKMQLEKTLTDINEPQPIKISHKANDIPAIANTAIKKAPKIPENYPAPVQSEYGNLGRCERAILSVLAQKREQQASNPKFTNAKYCSIARAKHSLSYIGIASGYSSGSGGFNNALSKLRTLELIEGYGDIKASDNLFS